MTPAIKVWHFENAPKKYRDLSTNGGDEDWVVFVPAGAVQGAVPMWLEATDTCHEPQRFYVDGGKVYIGSHS